MILLATVEGSPWRIYSLIFCVIVLFSMYTSYVLFSDIQVAEFNEFGLETGFNNSIEIVGNGTNVTYGVNQGNDFISILTGIGGWLTFSNIENEYARLLFNVFIYCTWAYIGFLIYTFIRDWIPFVG